MNNRQIKFRAYHIGEEKMCNVELFRPGVGAFLSDLIPEPEQIVPEFRMIVPALDSGRFCDLAEFHLLQYTGLKDKNGVEIYEGHIVKCVYKSSEGGGWYSKTKEQGTVYFDTHWGVKFDCSGGTQRTAKHWKSELPHTDFTDVEIIGNIYENKNLI